MNDASIQTTPQVIGHTKILNGMAYIVFTPTENGTISLYLKSAHTKTSGFSYAECYGHLNIDNQQYANADRNFNDTAFVWNSAATVKANHPVIAIARHSNSNANETAFEFRITYLPQ
jgi:hypothetical protein